MGKLVSFYRHIYLNMPKVTMLTGILLVALVGLIHLVEAPAHFRAAPHLGALFVINFALSAAAAVGIPRGAGGWGWALGAAVSGVSVSLYLVSRLFGLPGFGEAAGAWGTPLGSVTAILEALYLGLYFSALTNLSVAYPDGRDWDEDWHDYPEPDEEAVRGRGGA